MHDNSYQPERREFGRRLVAFPGVIHLGCRPSVDCLVKDVSNHGAMLEVDRRAWLPGKFNLVVPGKFDLWCQLVHRTGDFSGVRFTTELVKLV
jgi:hypothetical protein